MNIYIYYIYTRINDKSEDDMGPNHDLPLWRTVGPR